MSVLLFTFFSVETDVNVIGILNFVLEMREVCKSLRC